MARTEHPLRRQVVNEMHLRRWPQLAAPMRLVQMLRLTSPAARQAEADCLAALEPGTLDPSDNPRQATGMLEGTIPFVLERHNEASVITLFLPPEDHQGDAANRALAWADALPGEVIRATRVLIVENEDDAEALLPSLAMVQTDLVSCRVGSGGSARIWSDFRIGTDGMGCLLIAAGGMTCGDLTRLVQRLQELGNYRNLALLGLPVAQAHWEELNRAESSLAELAGLVTNPETSDEALLEKVSALSLDLMRVATGSRFRMSATAAYARIAEERLAEIAPQPIKGYPSLVDFTERRLLPAVRTCAAHVQRQAELALSADRFTALLRTRVETRIEAQNAHLLHSLDRSAATQLRLQQLVEGFSVVAISYYAVALVGYVLKGLEHYRPGLPVPEIMMALVPATCIIMWLGIHRLKKRVLGAH